MKNFVLILLILILACTSSKEQTIRLNGKIAIERSNGVSSSLYFPDGKRTVSLRYDKNVGFAGLHWANTTDTFVGVVQLKSPSGRVTRRSIALFNVNGQIIDTVYHANENELAGNAYLSRNDSKLVFSLEIDHFDPTHPLDQLSRPISILVMDFKNKTIIHQVSNIGPTSKISFHESPWFKDESFIYCVRNDRRIIVNEQPTVTEDDTEGIYLCNVLNKSTTLLIPGGLNGIVSPVTNEIAYIKDSKIWIFDLIKKTSRVLYKASNREKITSIHWTPDAQHIYLTTHNELPLNSFMGDEKLIRSDNGSEVSFDRQKSPGANCTWK